MPRSRSSILARLNSEEGLKISIRQRETAINSLSWSLDWHLKNTPGASITDYYSVTTMQDMERATSQLEEFKIKLAQLQIKTLLVTGDVTGSAS